MRGPNVLFVVLDTARARTVFGDDADEVAPRLTDFADSGVRFANATANGPWTLPSHASMFTGQRTSDHGAHAGTKAFTAGRRSLPARLGRMGYQTAAFSNNPWISPSFGFDGFEEFSPCWKLFSEGADLASIAKMEDRRDQLRELASELLSPTGPQTVANALYMQFLREGYDSGARRTVRRMKRWFRNRDGDRPFFAFANFMEPHLAYDPPERFQRRFLTDEQIARVETINQDAWAHITGADERTAEEFEILEGLYKAELRYLDHRLGGLLDFLADAGELDDTAVVIVGDHGENIGDHGLMDHQYCLYDTLVHVPLVMSLPGGDRATTCEDPVELRDLYPTVLSLAGGDPSELDAATSGNVLADGDEIGSDREYAVSEYLHPQPEIEAVRDRYDEVPRDISRFDRALRAVRTPEWKYVEGSDGTEELYDLTDDPAESRNLAADRPETADRLRERATAELGPLEYRSGDATDIEAGTKRQLEELGYL
ncbi:sulfatase-like hydrolase/transferase (plasmid) [Halorussus limi]|uniref:Sulfatase-like hydrolase/transferase n=1 Tax=Halorussus limi TaxID=2938695 RepID=A0A8U0I1S3_9EURY|nr:sulfatase-like hydrolase/transferase [Halorussus limi]UPV76654.1 sulfatase-like hydrolase/transferase [Halorussus limi]